MCFVQFGTNDSEHTSHDADRTQPSAGGVVTFPAGTFAISKRLRIVPTKPLVLRGLAPDISRLVWRGNTTEGIAILPAGWAEPLMNDALVTVTGARPI